MGKETCRYLLAAFNFSDYGLRKRMKAVELINRAFVLSGIIARDLEQVQGSEGRDGLFWLNQLLAEKSINGDYLPYYSHPVFASVNGQQKYFVEGLITLDVITFSMGAVRYSIRGESRRSFWGDPRAENIDSLPFCFYYERVNGGMDIYFYFKPQGVTSFTATGLSSLAEVTNDTQLNDHFDKFYQSFLIFDLAERLCQWYKISLPPAVSAQLEKFRNNIYNMNPKDMTINKKSMFSCSPLLSYAQVAFGKGWTVRS